MRIRNLSSQTRLSSRLSSWVAELGVASVTALGVAALSLTVACGGADDSREQMLPSPADSSPKPIGSTDFTINKPVINSLWGSDSNLWGVGEGAQVVNWDGQGWRRVAVPTGNDLLAVWGSSSSDVWAVGKGGVVIHWDGSRWARTTVPVADSVALNDVWGTSASDVWVVGDNGVILHYNGTAFSTTDLSSINNLLTVWASSTTDVWVGADLGLLLHFDGSHWTEVASGSANPTLQIRGTSASKVWAVKETGESWTFDGTKWSLYSASITGSHIWLTGDKDIWIYGSGSDSYHYDGTSWTDFDLFGTTALWSSSASSAWTFEGTDILRWNGSSWNYRW